mgnify:CR=1 FL=1
MHILHVTPYYAPAFAFGGVVRAVEGMARALTERGHTVTVLTTNALTRYESIDELEAMIDGVRVIRVPNVSLKLRADANLSTPLDMRRLAPDVISPADVIHCHEFRTSENVIVTPLAQRLSTPLVLSPHGTLTHETGRGALKALWDRAISPSMARRFAGVIGLSDDETEDARAAWQRFGATHTAFATIPNGVDADEFASADPRAGAAFRQQYGLGDAPMVLFMGRLHRRKGIDVLIDAFEDLDHPRAKLVIAGADEGILDAIQPHLNERVQYVGFLDSDARRSALAAADVFALPAVGEGLPMALLEALASGVAVLISPDCHLPDVETANAGLIVPSTVDDVIGALRGLLDDPDLRRVMGQNGRALIREKFTWASVAARLEAFYGGLIEG